jgi:NADH-quinone oxidoreductase subunit K
VTLGLIGLAAGGSHSLNAYLTLSGLLFAIGMFGFLARRNAISMVMAIELMLNAVNLAIIGFASFNPKLGSSGSVIALLVMAVAAGEATVGLSIILAIIATDWGEVGERVHTVTDELATVLFASWVLPFEIVGVLLLAAVIGGVFLAKRERSGEESR